MSDDYDDYDPTPAYDRASEAVNQAMVDATDPDWLCHAEVSEPPHYLHRHRCYRMGGHGRDGLYCRQHAKQRRYSNPKEASE